MNIIGDGKESLPLGQTTSKKELKEGVVQLPLSKKNTNRERRVMVGLGLPFGKGSSMIGEDKARRKGRGELTCRALPWAGTNEGEREEGGASIKGGCGPHQT